MLEAEMVKDILESGGMPVAILSSKVRPYPVNIGRMGEVRVLVREEDISKAREVMEKTGDDCDS